MYIYVCVCVCVCPDQIPATFPASSVFENDDWDGPDEEEQKPQNQEESRSLFTPVQCHNASKPPHISSPHSCLRESQSECNCISMNGVQRGKTARKVQPLKGKATHPQEGEEHGCSVGESNFGFLVLVRAVQGQHPPTQSRTGERESCIVDTQREANLRGGRWLLGITRL